MQKDFHYYAAYCAAYIAGYSHEEALVIAYFDQFVDCCSKSFLSGIKADTLGATTQLQLEMMDARTDIIGLQDITRIWASFHFLPCDLHAKLKFRAKPYKDKYRLICGPNGELLKQTINLVNPDSLSSVGLAMHILSDTWAHRYFAGTPSFVINNTNYFFKEVLGDEKERTVRFVHNPGTPDNLEKSLFTNTLYSVSEKSVMNLGHGRAGHLPDYSFARYKYLPAWANYEEVYKDNPSEYYQAFCQMVYALACIQNGKSFDTDIYAWEEVEPYKKEIWDILTRRQPDACNDWKAFGEKLSGIEIEDFDEKKYVKEYTNAPKEEKEHTLLGEFISAAIKQKSMVTDSIFMSGNLLAGLASRSSKEIIEKIKKQTNLSNKRKGGVND